MQYSNFLSTTFLLAVMTSVPTAQADECAAVGRISTNAAGGFAGGGGAVTGSEDIIIYRGDTIIGNYTPGDNDSPVCSDQIGFPSELPDFFLWGASCTPVSFTECHGAYQDQTHIDGEDPSSDNNFYGVGISSEAECVVKFDC